MNTESPSVAFFHTSFILKLTGIILVLSGLAELAIAMFPPDFLNSEWLANLITEFVGRGIVPLIGTALLFFGVWLDTNSGTANPRSGKSLLSWAIVLSGILGLLFLLLTPLYFNSSRLVSAAATRSINEEAVAAETELNLQLEQRRSVVNTLLEDEQNLAELRQRLQSDELSEQERTELQQVQTVLQEVQADPKRLDQRLEETRKQGLADIQSNLQQTQDAIKSEMRKSRTRVILTGVMLSIGYLSIAWTGMGLGSLKPARSKQAAKQAAKPPAKRKKKRK